MTDHQQPPIEDLREAVGELLAKLHAHNNGYRHRIWECTACRDIERQMGRVQLALGRLEMADREEEALIEKHAREHEAPNARQVAARELGRMPDEPR